MTCRARSWRVGCVTVRRSCRWSRTGGCVRRVVVSCATGAGRGVRRRVGRSLESEASRWLNGRCARRNANSAVLTPDLLRPGRGPHTTNQRCKPRPPPPPGSIDVMGASGLVAVYPCTRTGVFLSSRREGHAGLVAVFPLGDCVRPERRGGRARDVSASLDGSRPDAAVGLETVIHQDNRRPFRNPNG
jgi:hypothetical protein